MSTYFPSSTLKVKEFYCDPGMQCCCCLTTTPSTVVKHIKCKSLEMWEQVHSATPLGRNFADNAFKKSDECVVCAEYRAFPALLS